MQAALRLFVAFVLALLLLGSTPPAEAQSAPEGQCSAAYCLYLPLVARHYPLAILDTQFTGISRGQPYFTGVAATVVNLGAEPLYDVTIEATVEVREERATLTLRNPAPVILPGTRLAVSSPIGDSLHPSAQDKAVVVVHKISYSTSHSPPSVAMSVLKSDLCTAIDGVQIVVRNDGDAVVRNLWYFTDITGLQHVSEPSSLNPGETATLSYVFESFQGSTYCSIMAPVLPSPIPPPTAFVQAEVVP